MKKNNNTLVKKCNFCKEIMSVDKFYLSTRDGYQSNCIACKKKIRELQPAGIYRLIMPHYYDILDERRFINYIGYTFNLDTRPNQHMYELRSDEPQKCWWHTNYKLIEGIHGKEKAKSLLQHEILYKVTPEELDKYDGKSPKLVAYLKELETKYYYEVTKTLAEMRGIKPYVIVGNKEVPNTSITVLEHVKQNFCGDNDMRFSWV